MKTKLNLSCGNRVAPVKEWINHDIWAHREEVESVHDLNVFPWPWADSSFTDIVAFDIIEHVNDPMEFIKELWRISRNDAKILIHTAWASPHPEGRAIWRDPTHKRPFHEDTFDYFDPINGGGWYENYGKFYSPARLEVLEAKPEPPDNILFRLRAIKE